MEEEIDPKRLKTCTEMDISPPWLDLPDPITELILERLPLPDYLRFATVCRKWRSIQKNHRLRYSSSQPPVPHYLPWLIPMRWNYSRIQCYSPFDQTFHYLRSIYSPFYHLMFSSHGWIGFIHNDPLYPLSLSLVNPITAVEIELPYFPLDMDFFLSVSGAMSSPPSDPTCTILLLFDRELFLYRVNGHDECWTHLQLPLPTTQVPHYNLHPPTVGFFGGKFYCITPYKWFYVIDPALPNPSVRILDMDTAHVIDDEWNNFLVEFGGEVLLVMMPRDSWLEVPPKVYRPDFSEKMWVAVNQLGEFALFIHYFGCFSLSADVVGCKKNCIYHPKPIYPTVRARGFGVPGDLFDVFDLETGRWIDEQSHQHAEVDLSQFMDKGGMWLLPRLDHVI